MGDKITKFTDLMAWKEGHELVLSIYEITKYFPKEELFGLVSQMRRCAVSITSNIAEGFGRHSYKEKIQFYLIARGSLIELQNQLLVAKDVKFLDEKLFKKLAEKSVEAHKILNGLIKGSRAYV